MWTRRDEGGKGKEGNMSVTVNQGLQTSQFVHRVGLKSDLQVSIIFPGLVE